MGPARAAIEGEGGEREAVWTNIPFKELTVGENIGGGGVALVYRGFYRQRSVAVKILVGREGMGFSSLLMWRESSECSHVVRTDVLFALCDTVRPACRCRTETGVHGRATRDEVRGGFWTSIECRPPPGGVSGSSQSTCVRTTRSKLRHTNVVKLIGACTQPPNLCMVMELCEGSLHHALHATSQFFSVQHLVRIAVRSAAATIVSQAILSRSTRFVCVCGSCRSWTSRAACCTCTRKHQW